MGAAPDEIEDETEEAMTKSDRRKVIARRARQWNRKQRIWELQQRSHFGFASDTDADLHMAAGHQLDEPEAIE
jgi:hypothetical protein